MREAGGYGRKEATARVREEAGVGRTAGEFGVMARDRRTGRLEEEQLGIGGVGSRAQGASRWEGDG